MLYRLYTRWSERHGYTVDILDILEAEGGIKSVTLQVNGSYAYGYLKAETGIHRLVRISPFDSNARRHTSFASVFCLPRAGRHHRRGHQARGPADRHLPRRRRRRPAREQDRLRGAHHAPSHRDRRPVPERAKPVQEQGLRHEGPALAPLRVLQERAGQGPREARLEKKDISWGNQIRSYTFQPYTLVKDHRTKHEVGNIQAVMDGEIDSFIEEYLKQQWLGRGRWRSTS